MARQQQEIIDDTVCRYTKAIHTLDKLHKSPVHPILIGYKDFEILCLHFSGFDLTSYNIRNSKKKYGFKIV